MTHKESFALADLRSLLTFTFLPTSWRKHLDLIRTQRFQPYFIVAFTLWLVGAVEIVQRIGGQRLDPRFWMLIALMITAYSAVRVFRLVSPRASSHRSAAGRAADQLVQRMVSSGLTVHQDENGSGGYVVVGPSGIFPLEVKAGNVFGSRTIECGQDELVLGGRISDARVIRRAKAMAAELRGRLEGMLPGQSAVKPLVVFLNEWQINGGQGRQDVAVVNENELQQYFGEQKPILDSSQLATISACLN